MIIFSSSFLAQRQVFQRHRLILQKKTLFIVFFLAGFSLFPFNVSCEEVLFQNNYSVFSSNGLYVAQVTGQGTSNSHLNVYRCNPAFMGKIHLLQEMVEDKSHYVHATAKLLLEEFGDVVTGEKVWESDFQNDGYRDGLYVSNDGQTVIKIFAWSDLSGGVFFYRNGKMIKAYNDMDIPFDREHLPEIDGYRLWIMNKEMLLQKSLDAESSNPAHSRLVLHGIENDQGYFFLTTIDGKRHHFDLETAQLIESQDWLFTKDYFDQLIDRREIEEQRFKSEQRLQVLLEALTHSKRSLRSHAAHALGVMGQTRAVDPLIEALEDEAFEVRMAAAWALGEIGDERAVVPVKFLLYDNNSFVQKAAKKALRKIIVRE